MRYWLDDEIWFRFLGMLLRFDYVGAGLAMFWCVHVFHI